MLPKGLEQLLSVFDKEKVTGQIRSMHKTRQGSIALANIPNQKLATGL